MRLDDFIAQTLLAVVQGVKGAGEGAENLGGRINPYHSESAVQLVVFDVSITTSEASGVKGGAGIFVGPVAIGTKASVDESSSSVGRVQFTIPVQLPFARKGRRAVDGTEEGA